MHPSAQSEHSLLRDILLERSVRFGEFKLASGQVSDVYVDCRLTTFYAPAMPLIGRAFLRKMADLGWCPSAVGGLTIGADPIAFAIARESLESAGPRINAFVVRKEAKKHGMQKSIEGIDQAKDCPVVIIDDVCTTGISTAKAIENATEAEMNILGAICLVDREQGAKEELATKYKCRLESIFTLSEIKAAHDKHGATPLPHLQCRTRSD